MRVNLNPLECLSPSHYRVRVFPGHTMEFCEMCPGQLIAACRETQTRCIAIAASGAAVSVQDTGAWISGESWAFCKDSRTVLLLSHCNYKRLSAHRLRKLLRSSESRLPVFLASGESSSSSCRPHTHNLKSRAPMHFLDAAKEKVSELQGLAPE
jgi:hypothetical protein